MTRSGFRDRLGAVFVDWDANRGRPQIQCALALLRISQRSRSGGGGRSPGAILTAALYRTFALGVCSIDIPVSTRVGPRLQIHHGMGLVVHSGAVLGADVVLRQSTTIGSSRSGGGPPRLGDRVSVGPNVVVLGDITLEDGVVVGAGAVVLKDAAPGTVLVGNPARAVSP